MVQTACMCACMYKYVSREHPQEQRNAAKTVVIVKSQKSILVVFLKFEVITLKIFNKIFFLQTPQCVSTTWKVSEKQLLAQYFTRSGPRQSPSVLSLTWAPSDQTWPLQLGHTTLVLEWEGLSDFSQTQGTALGKAGWPRAQTPEHEHNLLCPRRVPGAKPRGRQQDHQKTHLVL